MSLGSKEKSFAIGMNKRAVLIFRSIDHRPQIPGFTPATVGKHPGHINILSSYTSRSVTCKIYRSSIFGKCTMGFAVSCIYRFRQFLQLAPPVCSENRNIQITGNTIVPVCKQSTTIRAYTHRSVICCCIYLFSQIHGRQPFALTPFRNVNILIEQSVR